MTFIRNFLDDMPFDSHDLAYYIVDEDNDHSVLQNRLPGGQSLPLIAHTGGVNTTRTKFHITPGPFGGVAISNYGVNQGYYGSDAVLDAPASTHISFCIYPMQYYSSLSAGTQAIMVGRTKVAPATNVTALDSTNFAIAGSVRHGVNGFGDGGPGDYIRRMVISANIGGTLQQIDLLTATQTSFNMHTMTPSMWNLIDIIRDNISGNIEIFTNGIWRPALFAGTLQGTGTGYWCIGQPFKGGTSVIGLPGRYARVRIMDIHRGVDWIRDRYSRMVKSINR